MEITQAPPPAFGATDTNTEAQASESTSEISSDFETFLRMLTVQLQNQDPLNPVESQDFAVQLATFSNVEQAVLTNDLLGEISAQIGGSTLQQLSDYVGMDVLAQAPVSYSGDPITIRPEVHPDADSAELVVRDRSGAIVDRQPMSLGQDALEWSGSNAQGGAMPFGIYEFEVESLQGDTTLETKPAAAFNRVEEARSQGDGILLTLSDGTEIPASEVYGMRTSASNIGNS